MQTQTESKKTKTTRPASNKRSDNVRINAVMAERYGDILSEEALAFVAKLQDEFGERRVELLAQRGKRQQRYNDGAPIDFLPETHAVREASWQVAAIREDLRERRVEITGPVERKMIINALNSGANVFMADFEDSNAPTWDNVIQGQINLYDAVRRQIEFTNEAGKKYVLNAHTATLMVRPRGWHLLEKHISVEGEAVSASLFDFGLYFFHNAKELLARGTGPYFYLPKLENYLEARLWNDVFVRAQEMLGIDVGSIRATVLIETIEAAFQMDEILYELREHSAGLNCGRWDYIFSIIKKTQGNTRFTLPDRAQVGMTRHNMHSYSRLAIQTCHKRGIHAMGGMAAQIPIKNDEQANNAALGKVREDKEREAGDGHDGTWVAHPGLVQLARDAFDARMPGPNQIDKRLDDLVVTRADLLDVPTGSITEAGLRHNIDVGVRYMAAWLSGNGCVPIYNLMEDAATAEISRSQLWQWLHHNNARLEDGRSIDTELMRSLFEDVDRRLRDELGPEAYAAGNYAQARVVIEGIVNKKEFTNFMTQVGYELLG